MIAPATVLDQGRFRFSCLSYLLNSSPSSTNYGQETRQNDVNRTERFPNRVKPIPLPVLWDNDPARKLPCPMMDQLFRSHTELCATLRLAGRQMLQFEQQADESLERIRKVLKRADNIRKALENPPSNCQRRPSTWMEELVVDAPIPASESA